MAFNWMAFAGGAAKRATELRDESRQEAKQYEAEQRAAAERNMATISRRRAVADQVTGYTTYLKQNGVSDEQLQAVISSGPQAIQGLTQRVQAAVEANNNRPLAASDAQALVNMPEGFSPVDMTMEEFVRSTYGLSVPTPAAPEPEVGLLGTIFGEADMGRARERLSRTEMAEGMTIQQINAAARSAEYESLIPGTFATIAGTGVRYSPLDVGVDFAKDAMQVMRSVESSAAWSGLVEQATEDKDIATLEQEMLQNSLTPMIRGNAERYGEAFLRDQEDFIRNNLGDAYMDNLLAQYGLGDDAAGTTPQPTTDTAAVDSALQEALGDVGGVTTEEITTTELPPVDQVEPVDQAEPEVAPAPEPVTPETPAEADPQEVYQTLSQQGFDDMSIALLNNRGADMLQYVQDKGITDEEELVIALTEWGRDNNVVMPFDKSGLVYALKSFIDAQ